MTHEIRELADIDTLDFDKGGGLVTVVTQDDRTGIVLMVAFADRAALAATLTTGEMHYLSRSRGPWRKGATSGHVQRVVSLATDCDRDAVLARVTPAGPACHFGTDSCFGDAAAIVSPLSALSRLDTTIASRADATDSSTSYTCRLLADRNLRLKKLGEEAAELIVACADEDRERATAEGADLLYHLLVALRSTGAGLSDVAIELDRRSSLP